MLPEKKYWSDADETDEDDNDAVVFLKEHHKKLMK
jgi:hypothetical protein